MIVFVFILGILFINWCVSISCYLQSQSSTMTWRRKQKTNVAETFVFTKEYKRAGLKMMGVGFASVFCMLFSPNYVVVCRVALLL